ncbi:signal recognition particle receptor beta subunit-domain-containing protein [Tribonema minus]|uniref:Signal recognition particle receptor subunit beta n=1 Tax=Tribonema minus TaxID=303371 RepID=A0A835YTM3_9STRA|nr:signal recognition particle receptor beta subunit-domain-containing protein [Tribonema minus]
MRPSSLSIHADGTPDATDGSSKGSVTVTDFPGHERLRGGLRGELATSTAVIFMLDGTDLSSQVRLGGEMLYDILTDSSIERCKGLAIGCSKADLKVAKPDRVRAALTKELEQLRTTRWSIGMQGEEDTGRPNSFIPLGRQGQPLDLVVDCPCPLTVFTCSVKGEGLNAVRDFIAGCFE